MKCGMEEKDDGGVNFSFNFLLISDSQQIMF